eukprot:Gb_09636 [translate_table: standard]
MHLRLNMQGDFLWWFGDVGCFRFVQECSSSERMIRFVPGFDDGGWLILAGFLQMADPRWANGFQWASLLGMRMAFGEAKRFPLPVGWMADMRIACNVLTTDDKCFWDSANVDLPSSLGDKDFLFFRSEDSDVDPPTVLGQGKDVDNDFFRPIAPQRGFH